MRYGLYLAVCCITLIAFITSSCNNPSEVTANKKANVLQSGVDTVDIDNLDSTSLLQITPAPTDSGRVMMFAQCSASVDKQFTITNLSSVKRLKITSITMSGATGQFSFISMPSMPIILGRTSDNNNSVTFTLRYTRSTCNYDHIVTMKFGTTSAYNRVVLGRDTTLGDYNVNDAPSSVFFVSNYNFRRNESNDILDSLYYYTVSPGSTKSYKVYITNMNQFKRARFNNIRIEGPDASQFRLVNTSNPKFVNRGSIDSISIEFAPTTAGFKQAYLKLDDARTYLIYGNCSNEVNVDDLESLTGTNLYTEVNFGDVPLNQESIKLVEVKNKSSLRIRIPSSNSTQLAGGYTVIQEPTYPLIVEPGGSFMVTIRFKPFYQGYSGRSVMFGTKQENRIRLTGTGI